MSGISVLGHPANEEVVQHLEEALEAAKAGRILGFCLSSVLVGSEVESMRIGEFSVGEMLLALEHTKHHLLHDGMDP